MSEVKIYSALLCMGDASHYIDCVLASDYDKLKEENDRLRRVTHVSLPTSTMEYEFSNYHRRGFNAGIRQGEAERDQLKAELDRLRDVQILLNTLQRVSEAELDAAIDAVMGGKGE